MIAIDWSYKFEDSLMDNVLSFLHAGGYNIDIQLARKRHAELEALSKDDEWYAFMFEFSTLLLHELEVYNA